MRNNKCAIRAPSYKGEVDYIVLIPVYSIYFVSWVFGRTLPDGILWGHTLNQYIGHWGMYIGIVLTIIGGALIIVGWREIYRKYWKYKENGALVTTSIYRFIRHPQYTGFLLISFSMILEWATIPLLLMYPVLVIVYYRLARREEQDMEREFGQAYTDYKKKTGMFFPKIMG